MNDQASASSRVHVILGASGGIGSALSRRLASEGNHLVLAARKRERLEPLALELKAECRVVDATRFAEVDELLASVRETLGRIDGVACCAGSILLKSAQQTSEDEYHATVAANLTTAFATVRAASRYLQAPGGAIVLCSSAAARTGLAHHEAIAAAKAGVMGLVLSAAATLAPRGIRVNAVAPGLVRTPMTSRLTSNENTMKTSQAMHPLGRIGEPEDVAAALAWFLSPQSTWVTGQILGVDGGLADLKLRG
ncbi:MAG: SDR family oxidoreductase [Gemmataceae bacterium]